MTIQSDAREYVDILNGPANGWGQHVCPKTGLQSHAFLRRGYTRHGQAEFDAAVAAIFAFDSLKNRRKS